jgi:hypothetical protein
MREIVARYHTPLNEGKYYAKAVVEYDGREIVLEQAFELGNMLIDLKSIYVKDFRLGEIARFDLMIESKWNEQIPDVYADMQVKDAYGRQLTKFKTRETDLDPYTVEVLDAYWDTGEAVVGTYTAKVTLHFLGNNLEKTITLNVREDSIDIDFMPTAQVIGEEAPGTQTSFIIILIVVSMVINIALVLWLARRRK